jgi:predicted nucleic acid-binding protein
VRFDCAKAFDLPIEDYEDALIVACASKANIEYIISSDTSFLKLETPLARVITVKDFLKMLRS